MKYTMKWKVVPYKADENNDNVQDIDNKLSALLKNKNLSNDQIVNFYNKMLAEQKSSIPSNPVAHTIHTPTELESKLPDYTKKFDQQYEILEYIHNNINTLKDDIIEELTKQNRIVARPQQRRRKGIDLNKSILINNHTKKALQQLQQSFSNPLINDDKPPAQSTRNKSKVASKVQAINTSAYRDKRDTFEESDLSDMETSQVGRNLVNWMVFK